MKGKVIHAEKKVSKKGNEFHKCLVQFGDSVIGYCFYFGERKLVAGDTVEFAVGTDYQNNLRLEIR